MILRFPYLPDQRSAFRSTPSRPAGQTYPIRALIPVRLIGPAGLAANLSQVLVDTGSVDTIFPLGIASWIGAAFILPPPHVQWTVRWRGASYPLEFARIEIELRDATGALLRWPATVAFSSAPIPYDGLLGNRGCLTFMNATFRGEDQLLALEPARRFPGIQISP